MIVLTDVAGKTLTGQTDDAGNYLIRYKTAEIKPPFVMKVIDAGGNVLAAPSEADHAAVRHALVTTQAWDWRNRPLGQLSGGERQRVLLARALAVQAQVLLMDEPLANLDPPHQADWLLAVRELVSNGKTVVSVLHEISLALRADDVVVMAGGRVVHQGASAHAGTHVALQSVFDDRIAVHQMEGQWLAIPRV